MEEIKKRWTEYCRELYEEKEKNVDLAIEIEKNAPPPNEDGELEILHEEVEAAVKRLKRHKSPGTDGITDEMIQAEGEQIVDELHRICKQVWKEGRIPEEWAKSIIITIPKKGDLRECSNYRTISLLNHMGKVLTMVLLERLKAQVEPYISEQQQ